MEKEYQAICKICGGEGRVTLDPDVLNNCHQRIQVWIDMFAHDRCIEQRNRKQRAMEVARVTASRSAELSSIIPLEFMETDPNRLPQASLAKVMEWKYGKKGLLIRGDPMLGKTRSAYLLLKREHLLGRNVVACRNNQFAINAIMAMTEGGKRYEQWMDVMVKSDILFLDDLGRQRTTEVAQTALFEVIDGRVAEQRPTIITTNFTGNQLEEKFTETGGAVIGRFREGEYFDYVHFKPDRPAPQ